MAERKPLTAAMTLTDAARLGTIAAEVGRWNLPGVGSPTDRGIVLLKKLNDAGYDVVKRK